jgi:ribosomal protein S18 acetylase RimI-like enzyme
MELVLNKPEYWEFIRTLRNHPDVKGGFIQQEDIERESHEKYMLKYGLFFYVCLVGGQPAGYVGVINKDIRVATHPDFQGNGVGKYMINQLAEMQSDAFAKVKIENEASMKLFESCGFKKKYYILEKE